MAFGDQVNPKIAGLGFGVWGLGFWGHIPGPYTIITIIPMKVYEL